MCIRDSGYIERARAGVSSAAAVSVRAGAGAPDWAADETTRGVGRRKPFTLELSDGYPRGDDECERDGHDENAPLFSGRFSDDDDDDHDHDEADPRAGEGARDAFSFSGDACSFSPALLPDDARRACLFAAPVTVVAVRLTCGVHARGGLVAAGSATGAFAVWDPGTGSVVRPPPGAWGAQSAAATAGRQFAHSAITALCFLSDAGAEEEEGFQDSHARPSNALVLGGTRGGGVAAWDVVKGACVLANPGSHAGAVTVAAAAPGGASLAPGPAAGGAFGPTIALTASDAPCDGFVRLWDARAGPREAAAALAGHTGGVTAVSPRWRPRGGGAGGAPLAGRSGAFLTGDGAALSLIHI